MERQKAQREKSNLEKSQREKDEQQRIKAYEDRLNKIESKNKAAREK